MQERGAEGLHKYASSSWNLRPSHARRAYGRSDLLFPCPGGSKPGQLLLMAVQQERFCPFTFTLLPSRNVVAIPQVGTAVVLNTRGGKRVYLPMHPPRDCARRAAKSIAEISSREIRHVSGLPQCWLMENGQPPIQCSGRRMGGTAPAGPSSMKGVIQEPSVAR